MPTQNSKGPTCSTTLAHQQNKAANDAFLFVWGRGRQVEKQMGGGEGGTQQKNKKKEEKKKDVEEENVPGGGQQ